MPGNDVPQMVGKAYHSDTGSHVTETQNLRLYEVLLGHGPSSFPGTPEATFQEEPTAKILPIWISPFPFFLNGFGLHWPRILC